MEAAEVAAVVGMVAEWLDAEDYDEQEGITEESVAELMSWFELEIKLAAGGNALPLPPPQAAMYATMGEGKESCGPSLSGPAPTVMASVDRRAGGGEGKESCGPSLSGPASTVMASVDRRAGAPPAPPLALPWPWTWPVPRPAAGEQEEDVDEWVSQLLTDGPPAEGQHGAQ